MVLQGLVEIAIWVPLYKSFVADVCAEAWGYAGVVVLEVEVEFWAGG